MDVEADIYFAYTGKKEQQQHWALYAAKSKAELRQMAVELLVDLQERYPKAAVWIDKVRIKVTEEEREAYYKRGGEILAREAKRREEEPLEELGEQIDRAMGWDDVERKARFKKIADDMHKRKKIKCKKGGGTLWRRAKSLTNSCSSATVQS